MTRRTSPQCPGPARAKPGAPDYFSNEINNLGDSCRCNFDCPELRQRFDPRRSAEHLMGRDIERDHRDRDAAVEHDRRGMRVDMDVELGGRRVALPSSKQAPPMLTSSRTLPASSGASMQSARAPCWCHGPSAHWSIRTAQARPSAMSRSEDRRHAAPRCTSSAPALQQNDVDGRFRREVCFGGRERSPASGPAQPAWVSRDIGTPGQIRAIPGGALRARSACKRAGSRGCDNAENLHFLRRGERQQDRASGVVEAGVGIDDNPPPRCHSIQPSECHPTGAIPAIPLISAMALAGFRFFGQVLVQFMIVWQR